MQSFEMSGDLALTENSHLGSYLTPSPLDKQDLQRQQFFASVYQSQRPHTRCCLRESNRPITPCLNSFLRTASPTSLQVGKKNTTLAKQVSMWKERGRIWNKQKAEMERKLEKLMNVPLSKAGEIRLRAYQSQITDLQNQLQLTQRQLQSVDATRTFRLSQDLSACEAQLIQTKNYLAERDLVIDKLKQTVREKEIRGKMMESEIMHLKEMKKEEERMYQQKIAGLALRCASFESSNTSLTRQLDDFHSQLLSKQHELQSKSDLKIDIEAVNSMQDEIR